MSGPTLNGIAEELTDATEPAPGTGESAPAPTAPRGVAPRVGASPAVQAAAVAATTLVAGAATVVALRRVSGSRRSAPARRRRGKKRTEAVQVVASHSFLVDVHLIDRT